MPVAPNEPIPQYSYPYRVLIVDDEPTQRMLEREILEAPKYSVTEAANGATALAILQEQDFDAVLLDVRMPGIDGNEVCKRIRNELGLPMLPVIMVTGFGGHDDLAVSLREGASDFIRKPYHPMELMARVDSAVHHKRLTDQLDSAEAVLFALARMVEAKDETTGDHCTRLAHNVVIFGETLGLPAEELTALRRAGVLHDIGKLGIPDSILRKRGPLDAAEWDIMRQHTTIGAALCDPLKSMRLTSPIVRHHHERWDGSGYPHGLARAEIPLLARVFQIVDIFDALSFSRPYKPALPIEKVIGILQEETTRGWRDPTLVEAFLDLLASQPDTLLVHDNLAHEADGLGASLFHDIARGGALEWDSRAEILKAGQ
jgi:putative two-component system response regulator